MTPSGRRLLLDRPRKREALVKLIHAIEAEALAAVDVAKVTQDMSAAMPWYDESDPDFTDAENVLRSALTPPAEGRDTP